MYMNPFIIFLFVLSITQIIVTVVKGYLRFLFQIVGTGLVVKFYKILFLHVNHSKDFLHILHNEGGQ